MKKDFLFIMFFCFLISCSENDHNLPQVELEGKWNLIELHCGFCESLYLSVGEYTWTIDTSNENVAVENIANIEHPSLLATGNYNLEITDTTLTILSVKYDYSFEENILVISDHPEVDGIALVFVK